MGDSAPSKPLDFRDLIYADQGMVWMTSMAMGGGPQAQSGPWGLFRKAAEHVRAHDRNLAAEELKGILARSDVESRVRLWAWNCLRELGEFPDATGKDRVQGIVIDVPSEDGPDVLAVYADKSARYCNPDGKAIVWGGRAGLVSERIDGMLAEAQKVVAQMPRVDKRPQPRRKACLTLLTFSGLRSVEEDAVVLRSGRSPLSPVFALGMSTIVALVRATSESGVGGE